MGLILKIIGISTIAYTIFYLIDTLTLYKYTIRQYGFWSAVRQFLLQTFGQYVNSRDFIPEDELERYKRDIYTASIRGVRELYLGTHNHHLHLCYLGYTDSGVHRVQRLRNNG